MRRILAVLASLAVASQAAAAQATPAFPVPEVRPYVHPGTIDKSFEDEEKSTSVFLAMTMGDAEVKSFAKGNSRIRNVHLDAGFVHSGWVMSGYPEVVTIVLKLVHPQPGRGEPPPTSLAEMRFVVDGRETLTVSVPLVDRAAAQGDRRSRHVEDTYVVVLSLNQFLELVNGTSVAATLDRHELNFTGAPLEGLRDLASRMAIVR